MNTNNQVQTIASLRQPAPTPDVSIGFGTLASFELMQRAAKLLCASTLVPPQYRAMIEKKGVQQENPNALANAVVALNMAQRMGADPLMIMQNLYPIEGRPSWSSQFIIAAINGCGKFSPLRFDLKELGKKIVEYEEGYWEDKTKRSRKLTVEITDIECIAWATEKESGERLESPPVSIELAVLEGWYTKNGSKWKTMPQVMLRYRAASFFGKIYAPELLMGLRTVEEAEDIIDVDASTGEVLSVTAEKLRTDIKKIEGSASLSNEKPLSPAPVLTQETPTPQEETIDRETGEIIQASPDQEQAGEDPTAEYSRNMQAYIAEIDAIESVSQITWWANGKEEKLMSDLGGKDSEWYLSVKEHLAERTKKMQAILKRKS